MVSKLGKMLQQASYSVYELTYNLWNKTDEVIDNINTLNASGEEHKSSGDHDIRYYLKSVVDGLLAEKTYLNGDHKGTWQGFRPTQVSETITEVVDGHEVAINNIVTKIIQAGTSHSDIIDIINTINGLTNKGRILFANGDFILEGMLKIDNCSDLIIELSPNTKFKTNKHGWGIIEVTRSKNIELFGGKAEGSLQFVPKNFANTNGGGEKHYVDDQLLKVWGYYRNDELTDTVLFNNGWIGNTGNGVIIWDGCEDIKVHDMEIYGFNHSCIQIGLRIKPQAICKNIFIFDNNLHDTYSQGISTMNVDGFIITRNKITNIGHYDYAKGDTVVDPGYGITCNAVNDNEQHSMNGVISFNILRNCNRKGIDSHASELMNIEGNIINNTSTTGIALTGSSGVRKQSRIVNNTLINCGNADSTTSTTDPKVGILSNLHTDTIIQGNTIVDCGAYGHGIYVLGDKAKVYGNILRNSLTDTSQFLSGIRVGSNSTNISLNDNTITGNYQKGIDLNSNSEGVATNNEVDITFSTGTLPLYMNGSRFRIGKNKWSSYVSNAGNTGDFEGKRYLFAVTYNGNTIPTITELKYDGKLPYTIVSGGAGIYFQFDIGSLVTSIKPLVCAKIFEVMKKATNMAYIKPIVDINGGRYLWVYISPRTSTDTVQASNSSDLNGYTCNIEIEIPIQ